MSATTPGPRRLPGSKTAIDLIKETQDGLSRISRIMQSLKVFSPVDATQENEEYDLNGSIAKKMNHVLPNVLMKAVQPVKERYQAPGRPARAQAQKSVSSCRQEANPSRMSH